MAISCIVFEMTYWSKIAIFILHMYLLARQGVILSEFREDV